VTLDYTPSTLELTVTNPVPPGTTDGGGHGVVGMRERAVLVGGGLETRVLGGEFRVRASLPYRDVARA
jgi:signal transduction histidine kinase